ncbi:hypothetical protein [Sandaracinus amylolyticus]|uniref:hypothetical protein n=1 Tax=Sandaracinus amylolyticus TaxID=927083 RepID=UPI001F2BF27D|nr:hypothetical protein [Sandaracinus amylolyticus]UJR86237.1 Hypothetical protein I5071_83190 [Sandaracinus amylolyticus]
MSERALFGDRVRLVVIAVAVMSLVATVGALVFGRRLTTPEAQPRDSYGGGALGHRAFVETMRALGVRVQRWTRPEWDSVSAPLWIIEPNQPWVMWQSSTTTLGELVRARADAERVTVIVLPKWRPGVLGMVEDEDAIAIAAILTELPFAVSLSRGPIEDDWQTIEAREPGREATRRLELRWPQRVQGGVPVLSDDEGSFVVHDDKALIYVVSDPDLLHSFNLQRGAHAAFWRDFARDTLHAEDIVVDEVFHGAVRTRSLPELFGRWPGVLVLVHGAIVALVVLLMGRRRFGPPDPIPEALGRGPREVIEVAASVLANGSRETTLALRYVEDVIGDLHRRLGLSEAATVDARAALIDQAAERRRVGASATKLLAEARAVEKTRRRREALVIARRAAELRAALMGKKEERA